MKHSLMVSLLVALFCAAIVFAGDYNFELTVQNQSVSGTDFYFDIYMVRTGTLDIHLGNSDFALTFSSENFTNPTVSSTLQNDKIADEYQYGTDLKSGNIAIFNCTQPTINNQGQYDSRTLIPSTSGNGTFIARLVISGISNPSGTAGLQWRTSGHNRTIVNTLVVISTDPFDFENQSITSSGTYIHPNDASLPVELSSFSALVDKNVVILTWITESEIDNLGFNIYRAEKIDGEYKQLNQKLISGAGNSASQSNYTFSDERVENNNTYWYKLEDVDIRGNKTMHSPIEVTVEYKVPDQFFLENNYPNPFNSTTTINYGLPETSHVSLQIFNIRGQLVRELVNKEQEAGYYDLIWNGTSDQGRLLPSGIYFYRITTATFKKVKKLVFTK